MKAFGDFEFTCGGAVTATGKTELISVGVVVCDEDYNILEEYYSTAKPLKYPKLSSFCKKLTHLTNDEIKTSPDSEKVCREVVELLERYGIKKLYMWGDFDKIGLESDRNIHERKKLPFNNIGKLCGMIEDIQPAAMKNTGLKKQPGISHMMEAFSLEPEGEYHNALTDTKALVRICSLMLTEKWKKNTGFLTYKQRIVEKERLEKERIDQQRRKTLEKISPQRKARVESYAAQYGTKIITYASKTDKEIERVLKKSKEDKFTMIFFRESRKVRVIETSKEKNYDYPNVTHKMRFRRQDVEAAFSAYLKKIIRNP